MRAPLPLLIAGLVVSLAACGPKPEAPAPEAAAPPAEAAPAAEPAPPAPEPGPVAAVAAPDGETYPEAQSGCLDELAKVTNTDRAALTVTEINSAESGISVYVQVPGAMGKWFCLANPDGSVQGTEFRGETAPEASADAAAPALADQYPAAQTACLDAVAAKTNVDRATLTVTEVLWAEAGVGVTITVPGADAPWSCLADEAGNVQGAAYTGSEGAL